MSGVLRAVGLMSGTSMDGVDAALLETDGGERIVAQGGLTMPYAPDLRADLRRALGRAEAPAALTRAVTEAHGEAVEALLAWVGIEPGAVDLIGFHGHTVLHEPERRRTVQIGDGQALADRMGMTVVSDFRSNDVARGGQGAPFAPLFHAALAAALDRPVAVLNLGGVANVTWVGAGFDADAPEPDAAQILAFDTGPGNALIDDWVERHTGEACDRDGALARAGTADQVVVARLMASDYFAARPPKSLDRNAFSIDPLDGLGLEDGAATLVAFTAAAVARAAAFLPVPPVRWLVSGGGRHNPALMAALREALGAEVVPVEEVGWDGDALEAQAFAWLAARALDGRPLSLPTTTGVDAPCSGGRVHRPAERN